MKTLLVVSAIFFAGKLYAQENTVDNSVKYGEKYICQIETADQKKYTLKLTWKAVPVTYSTFPEWNETFFYYLKEGETEVDYGYFNDFGFGASSTELAFAYQSYSFKGYHVQPTRTVIHHSTAEIKLSVGYNNEDGKKLIQVASFKSSSEESYYRLYNHKDLELKIKSSTCEVSQ